MNYEDMANLSLNNARASRDRLEKIADQSFMNQLKGMGRSRKRTFWERLKSKPFKKYEEIPFHPEVQSQLASVLSALSGVQKKDHQ